MVGAWCEDKADFRTFRVDRIEHLEVLADTFKGAHSRPPQRYKSASIENAQQNVNEQ